ncbi:YggT family protein [Alicyclobacillus macrosporangiidus]|uniref:YggT family protein n=1 Tax=Alicyclobacillus macrosporangiidus TaxID=392015 RepID=UPI0004951137|nr:YggT family protein [Alicyclobacillus macrosporangiidus]MCL6598339.1 YggT family protein [Alicyclobacillus macrosporangiidus]
MELYTALLNLIQAVLSLYGYVLIATAVISWIPDLAETQLGQILSRLTEPYLRPFRRYIPPLQFGGVAFDLSFLVAVVVYFFLEQGVMYVLVSVVRTL